MNKINSNICFLTLAGLIAALTGCSTMQFTGYPVQDRNVPFSDNPLYLVEPSTATPELWIRKLANYEIRLKLEPEFPTSNDHVRMEVIVSDISRKHSKPVKGAKISAKAVMPNTPGYIHWIDNNICYLTEKTPGRCEMDSIVFGTGGDWDLIVKVEIPGEKMFSAVFPVVVKGPPWPPNYVPE